MNLEVFLHNVLNIGRGNGEALLFDGKDASATISRMRRKNIIAMFAISPEVRSCSLVMRVVLENVVNSLENQYKILHRAVNFHCKQIEVTLTKQPIWAAIDFYIARISKRVMQRLRVLRSNRPSRTVSHRLYPTHVSSIRIPNTLPSLYMID